MLNLYREFYYCFSIPEDAVKIQLIAAHKLDLPTLDCVWSARSLNLLEKRCNSVIPAIKKVTV